MKLGRGIAGAAIGSVEGIAGAAAGLVGGIAEAEVGSSNGSSEGDGEGAKDATGTVALFTEPALGKTLRATTRCADADLGGGACRGRLVERMGRNGARAGT